MALPLNNSAEGGTNGTTVTTGNSGGTSGNAWDAVLIDSNSSLVYSSAQAMHGSLSYKSTVGSGAQFAYGRWQSSFTPQATLYGRIYVYFTGNVPSGGQRIVEFWDSSHVNYMGGVTMEPGTPQLAIQDNTYVYIGNFSTQLSLNTWYRVEFQFQFQAGKATVKYFSGDSSTVIESVSVTGASFGGGSATGGAVDFAWGSGSSNVPAMYFDDVNLNSTGFPGPATSGPTSTGGFAVAAPAFAGTGQSAETMTGGIAVAPPAFAGNAGPVVPVTSTGSMAVAPPAFSNFAQESFPFPTLILNIMTEIFINGTWVDISKFVYYRQTIAVQRGRTNWASGIQSSTMTMTLNNRDGRFSPLNAFGPYYPYIQRNVQIRVSIVSACSTSFVTYSGYRFNGEVYVWPPQSDPTGTDIYCTINASGILTRYLQGAKVGSPIRRYYASQLGGNFAPTAAWLVDDATSAATIASMLSGGQAMTFTGKPSFMSDSSFLGSDPIAIVSGSTWHGQTGASGSPPATGSITEITPGTYTIIAPPGVSTFTVTEVGAGGAGGDTDGTTGGSGGGGGEQVSASIGVTAGSQYTYTVPSGGQAVQGGNGGAGGSAVFTGDTQTLTAHGGNGGAYAGGTAGAGGTGDTIGTHFNGGAGAVGSQSTNSNKSISKTAVAGATGGGNNIRLPSTTYAWVSPISGTVTVSGYSGGGGGAGGAGAVGGGGGGGGGAYATGTISVTAGTTYIANYGVGGKGGSAGLHGDPGSNTFMNGDSGSQVSAIGGAGGSAGGGGGAGGTVASGSGNPGGTAGNGAVSASSYGGGGGGGGSNGGPVSGGGGGSNGNQRGPGNGSGSGGRGGWGRILTGGSGGQTNGATGNQSAGIGGGGGGGGSTSDSGNNSGTPGGGGGPGQITWSWVQPSTPTGGGGGSSGGSAAVGGAGTTGGLGGTPPTNAGAGGAQGMPGSGPGGGGGGAVPAFGSNTANQPAGNGAPGQTTISWNGGTTSPVPSNLVSLLLHVDPAGETDGAVLFRAVTFGTINNLDLVYHAGGKLELKGFTGATTFFSSGQLSVGANGLSLAIQINLQAVGANISWTITVLNVNQGTLLANVSGTANTITLGNVSDVYVNPTASMNGGSATAMGGIIVQNYSDTLVNLAQMLDGFNGELMATRLARLCAEEGITFVLKGNASDTPMMGPQIDDTFLNLIAQCENADRGQVYEPREVFGIGYRTRVNMQGQTPFVLDYSQQTLSPPFQPVADYALTRNDLTISRYLGTSVTAQQLTGPMSIQSPPNGVGDYTFSETEYLYSDSQLANFVAWMLILGTVSQYRYPTVNLDLSRAALQNLFATIANMDIGDYFQVSNAPSWMTPATIDQLTSGYNENIGSRTWDFSVNAVPEDPFSTPNPPTW